MVRMLLGEAGPDGAMKQAAAGVVQLFASNQFIMGMAGLSAARLIRFTWRQLYANLNEHKMELGQDLVDDMVGKFFPARNLGRGGEDGEFLSEGMEGYAPPKFRLFPFEGRLLLPVQDPSAEINPGYSLLQVLTVVFFIDHYCRNLIIKCFVS